MTDLANQTRLVREEAYRLGFEQIGFSKAMQLDEEARHLEKWLRNDMHGTMSWMEGHFDMRIDPTKLVPGAQSVISLLRVYNPGQLSWPENKPRISNYALGDDYHDVMRSTMRDLFEFMRATIGDVNGRVFTDSAPIMDKAWAVRSGVGWQGKNGNVLNKMLGSLFFIGEIIVDAPFHYDGIATDHCGSCTRCIDACPTEAITEPYVVDARKCISYLTIELREAIPQVYHEQMGNWMYGCDICQDVCPWNSKAPLSTEERFLPRKELLEMTAEGWKTLDVETYTKLFKGSAAKRTKYPGLVRNIEIAAKNCLE